MTVYDLEEPIDGNNYSFQDYDPHESLPDEMHDYNFNEANYQKILQYAKIGIDSFNLIDNSNGK